MTLAGAEVFTARKTGFCNQNCDGCLVLPQSARKGGHSCPILQTEIFSRAVRRCCFRPVRERALPPVSPRSPPTVLRRRVIRNRVTSLPRVQRLQKRSTARCAGSLMAASSHSREFLTARRRLVRTAGFRQNRRSRGQT